MLRLDDSVESCTAAGKGRYITRMYPLRLPGLQITPTATVQVRAVPEGLQYCTQRVTTEYIGTFSGLVSNLQPPSIEALSELRVVNGSLVMDTEFLLTMPLPAWVPGSSADLERVAAPGNSLIRGIVEKDTRLSVARVKAEFAKWRDRSAVQAA